MEWWFWLSVSGIVYVCGAVMTGGWNDCEGVEDPVRRAVFWPILLVKWFLKNAVVSLCTGWRT